MLDQQINLVIKINMPKNPDTGEVPSAFFLADSLVRLDVKMEGGLLIPGPEKTKEIVAGEEAKRLKRLMSTLRHLFRNSFLAI